MIKKETGAQRHGGVYEDRADAQPCVGGCGRLVTAPMFGRYVCDKCRRREWITGVADIFRRGQPDAHTGGME